MAQIREVALEGHLTADVLKRGLDAIEFPAGGGVALLVDAARMSGYDQEARAHFVGWNKAHRSRLAGVAIVTTKTLWVMVISAMSLASGQTMKAFADRAAAEAWCRRL